MAGWSSLSLFTVGVRAAALPARASSLLGRGQPEKSGLAAWDPPQVDLVVKDLWGEAISQILRFWSTQEGNGYMDPEASTGQQGWCPGEMLLRRAEPG